MNASTDGTPAARTDPDGEPLKLPDPAPAHPLLDGLPEIGRGEFSIVLEKGDERVYKLISSPADYFLYTAEDRPRGAHFPILFADHGIIGRASSGYPFHLLEIERLYPLDGDTPSGQAARKLTDAFFSACEQWRNLGPDMGRIALHHLTVAPLDIGDSLRAALRALSDFVEEYQVRPDLLNINNLMMRKNGVLVFSDPIFIA